jgi:hypothetical protein
MNTGACMNLMPRWRARSNRAFVPAGEVVE